MYGFSGFPLTGVLETGVSDRPDKGLTRMRKPWLSIAKHDLLYERKAKIMFCKTPVCKTPVCKTRVCKRETFAKPLFVKQKLKWVTKSVSFSCQDPLNSPKASAFPQLSLSFPSAFPQLSVSFSCYPFSLTRFGATEPQGYIYRFRLGVYWHTCPQTTSFESMRPISLLRFWISEGLTQAES